MSQTERMAAMFAAIDDDGRRFIMVMLEGEYERVQQARRPALRLIRCGPSVPGVKDRKQAKGGT
ncbi:MAG: hypothetical protein ACLGI6_08805 [Gammaproteobacteria bacterium]